MDSETQNLRRQRENTSVWNPFSVLHCDSQNINYALVVLNSPFTDVSQLSSLWHQAKVKIVVDGAANELHDLLPELVPDLITGDFDSILPNVFQYYRDKGCETYDTPDQNQTDFTKALLLLEERLKTKQYEVAGVVVLEGGGGRLDHVMANINTLYLMQDTSLPATVLVSTCSLTMLLAKGKHEISVTSKFRGDHCGLIPIGAPCHHVTTKGFKWNLNDQALQFGHLVSTSNGFDGSETVTVETEESLLFTMSIHRSACAPRRQ